MSEAKKKVINKTKKTSLHMFEAKTFYDFQSAFCLTFYDVKFDVARDSFILTN